MERRFVASRRHRWQRRPCLESLENRSLLAADVAPLQNPFEPMDVDNDQSVSPADALAVIDCLNSGAPQLPDGETLFADVNGDRDVSPLDALMLINRLNGQDAEGETRAARTPPEAPRPSLPIAPINGVGHNPAHPSWGSAGESFLRGTTSEYGDGISSPAGPDRPSARDVSNRVMAQTEDVPNARMLSNFVWQWGQFLDHDIDLTDSAVPEEPFPISVPTGDPWFDPQSTGTQTIGLTRSNFDPETGISADDPRQQINSITAWIDGSMVYGSDAGRASDLRSHQGGRLRTSEGDLLPFNSSGLPNAGGTSDQLFIAGDIRVNEQVGLMAIHTLFVREHNRIADQLASENPLWTDEQLYQAARRVVIGEIQSITYNEFLPALLGPDAIAGYRGYNPEVNPGIHNLFATAAYRFGHTTLGPQLARLNEDGTESAEGNLALRDSFFRLDQVTEFGIDSLVRGLATQQAQEIDTRIGDDVRNFLFGPPGSGGFDLASLNIQRGRDHGLPDYNQARKDLGLEPATSFADIASDPDLQQTLEDVYGDVNNIDVWVGGLAEDHVAGGSLGELFTRELVDQFTRLRDGDRFWYQNLFRGTALQQIESTTLADVIRRNSEAQSVQDNVFFVPEVIYHESADHRSLDVSIAGSPGGVTLLDQVSQRAVASRSSQDAAQAVIVGTAGRADRLQVDLRRQALSLSDGIVFEGGRGPGDVLVIQGSAGVDRIQVGAHELSVNGLTIAVGGVEEIHVFTGPGDDIVQVADGLGFRVVVDPAPFLPTPAPLTLMPTGPAMPPRTPTAPTTPSPPANQTPPNSQPLMATAPAMPANSNTAEGTLQQVPVSRPRDATPISATDAIFGQLGAEPLPRPGR